MAAPDRPALHHRRAEGGAEEVWRLSSLRTDGWRTVHEGVEVKLTRQPETGETVILCRSADRRSKEQAMHDKFSRRIETALAKLAARVARSTATPRSGAR